MYEWKESVIIPIHKMVKKLTITIIVEYHYYKLHIKYGRITFSQFRSIYRGRFGG
jgi:hypothetical protein